MKQSFLVIAAFVLTFAAGVLTGALVVRQFASPPPPFELRPGRPGMGPERLFDLNELQKRLDLNDTQRQQIAAVLDKYRDQIEQHVKQVRPPMHELFRGMRDEIERILTPEQREKFRQPPPHFGRRPPPRHERFEQDSTRIP